MDVLNSTEHRYIDVGDDLRLHAAVSGSGKPVVLLHGFTGSTATWEPLRAVLEEAHKVVAVDFPGHGLSTAPTDPRRYALDRFADDLDSVLTQLSIKRVGLLGYSMGGRAALRFALTHADRVMTLILESTSPGITDPARRAERVESDTELANSIERDGIESFVERWEAIPLWHTQASLDDDVRAKLRSQRLRNQTIGLANSLRGAGAGADHPVLEQLSDIHAPVLLIAGALDATYVEHARTMEKSLPNCRTVIVPDAGHAVHLERPEEFGAAVRDFLNSPASG